VDRLGADAVTVSDATVHLSEQFNRKAATMLLALPPRTIKIVRMLGWIADVVFARQIRGRRRRELRFLLLAILLGLIVCAVIAGVLYAINNQTLLR
jgi:uncharacterized membrane protein AbrB (regulator of aidB expression)